MDLVDELKMWGYHSDISEEGKKQHLEMAAKAEDLKQDRDALVRYIRVRSGKRIEGDIGDNDDYRSAYMAIPEATRKEVESDE